MANANSNTKATKATTATTDEAIFSLQAPYAEVRVRKYDAYDHTKMRAEQLSGLMLLMTGDGFAIFSRLAEADQGNLLWLVQQLAEEVDAMIPIVSGNEHLSSLKRIEP
jgi:hypothetical protein